MYDLGFFEQAPLPNAQQETWTQASLYLSFSYLCVLQVLPKSNTECDLLSRECSAYLLECIQGPYKLPLIPTTAPLHLLAP